MRTGVFEGWRGVLLTLVIGTVLTAVAIAVALWASRDYEGVGEIIRTEPGAVTLPGELVCRATGTPQAVDGPVGARSVVALRSGEALVLAGDGQLWHGDPFSGALEPWTAGPGPADLGVGEPLLLGDEPIRRDVFVVGTDAVAAVDVRTGAVRSRQPLPDGVRVVSVTATARQVYLVAESGELYAARWAYRRVGEVHPAETRDVPPVHRALASRDGKVLLLSTDGPLTRMATATGGGQPLPVPAVTADAMTIGWDGLVHLADVAQVHVLDLGDGWVTGRLSDPVTEWASDPVALAGLERGLVVVGADGSLRTTAYPQCNREELTRLPATTEGS